MTHAHDQARLTLARRIDAVCDRFESAWKAGERPRIEDCLGQAVDGERTELLRALLQVELELLTREINSPRQVDYLARFPDSSEVVIGVFQEAARRTTAAPAADTSLPGQETTAAAQAKSAELPRTIGRFEILQVLGQGAFGRVYRARDPQLDREVAIKVPLREALQTAEDLQRFLREARAAATLHHPNICPVHEVGQEEGQHYIVMGFIPGKSLAAMLRERQEPLPIRQAVLLVRKLALALETAHAKGIIHRDLKPANLLLDRDRKEVVITDFGLARRQKAEDAVQTREGVIMGSPAYMAPEQARGNVRAIGATSDVYSLGVILYELLTGRLPFLGSVAEVLGQVLHVEPQPLSSYRPEITPLLEALCLKALAKDPAHRHRSMKELADALNSVLREEPEQKAPAEVDNSNRDQAQTTLTLSAKPRSVKGRRRGSRWRWLAGAFVLGALVLCGILFFARTPTATVLIQIDVNLDDPALRFTLDGKEEPAEKLRRPVELAVGNHELAVYRGEEEIRRFRFTVSGGAEPVIALKEERPRKEEPLALQPKAPPVALQPQTPPKKFTKDSPPSLPLEPPPGAALQDGDVDPDRRAAERTLEKGGKVTIVVNGRESVCEPGGALPTEPFRIRRLNLVRCAEVNNTDLFYILKGLTKLKWLALEGTQVDDDGLAALLETPTLEYLQVGGTKVRGSGLERLKVLPKLRGLALHGPQGLPENIKHISGLTELRSLEIDGHGMNDDSLQRLRTLVNLETLDLVNSFSVTGRGCVHLKDLPKLHWIDLRGNRHDDEALAAMGQLKTISEIIWGDVSAVTDKGLAALTGAANLRYVNLHRSRVTNDGLQSLKAFKQLRVLNIGDTQIGDAGLVHLRSLTSLERLHAKGARLTAEGVAALKKAIPGCMIEHD